jgi:hypothetical protein
MSDPPTPPAVPRGPAVHLGRLLFGFAVAVLGVLWLLQALDVARIDWDVGLPIAVIAIGVALVVAGLAGRGSGGLVVIGIVLSVVLLVTTVVDVPLGGGIGDRTVRPTVPRDRTYELAIGQLTIDLTRAGVDIPMQPVQHVRAHLGVGQLVVIVPVGLSGVEVHAKAGIGDVSILGRRRGGLGVDYRSPQGGSASIVLELSVGVGQVEVRRG